MRRVLCAGLPRRPALACGLVSSMLSTTRGVVEGDLPSLHTPPPATLYSALASEALARNAQELSYHGWIDDTKHEAVALRRHRTSPEYRELHRPGLTNSAMGLFGGEPGFEKSHRVWVDPDKPHLKYLYNSTTLAKNIRYARYGYYKREMHLLDIDKLVRHARMLPVPSRLLTDFMFQKVPLADKDCAALLRYARRNLYKLDNATRQKEFDMNVVEMFERMLSANIPPIEVGAESHTEMIRCCAVAKRWKEGWGQYRVRALELEQDYVQRSVLGHSHDQHIQNNSPTMEALVGDASPGASSSTSFVLGSRFYDALLELCVACEMPAEGLEVFAEFLQRGILPQASSLNHAMLLVSMLPSDQQGELNATSRLAECDDIWKLFELFGLQRDVTSIRNRMQCCALLGNPHSTLDAMRVASQTNIMLNEMCYQWCLYALRYSPDMTDFVLDLLSQARSAGLCVDYRVATYALMYCAFQCDGDGALIVYQQHVLGQDMNLTAEMLLLLLQAFRRSPSPSVDMLQCAQDAWRRFHRVGSAVDLRLESLEEMMTLCAQLGAAATAFSLLKEVVGKGHTITTLMLNAILKANALAQAPNGSASLTDEVVELFGFLKTIPTIDTAEALLACHDVHGSTRRVQAFTNALVAHIQGQQDEGDSADGGAEATSVGSDELPDLFDTPPHRLRNLSTELRIESDEIALRKYGQTCPLPAKADGEVTVLGRVQPFGAWPGIVDA